MARSSWSLVVVLVALSSAHASSLPAQTEPSLDRFHAIVDSMRHLTPDPTRVATVRHLVLTRDVGTLTLDAGTIALLAPVGGRTIGAVFIGSGRFTFAPPTGVERENLGRFFDKKTQLDEPITGAVLLFTDSTLAALDATLTFAPRAVDDAMKDAIGDALDYLSIDTEGHEYDPDVLRNVLDGDTGLFYAHLLRDGDPWMFEIDPYETEDVRFYHHQRLQNHGAKYPELVSSFPDARFRAAPPRYARLDDITVRHYAIETWLDLSGMGNLKFHAATRMVLASDSTESPWAMFILYPELDVDSAHWADGQAATVTKDEKSSQLWVGVGQRLRHGADDTLTLYYHGDLFEHDADMYYLNGPSTWYPLAPAGRNYATFDLTYHSPKSLSFVSVGQRTDSTVQDAVLTTHWMADTPMRNATFDIGGFDPYHVPDDSLADVTVLVSSDVRNPMRHMKEQVGEDVEKSLEFYTHQFGATPLKTFYAAETPGGEGLAFPGLVKLSFLTFLGQDKSGENEMFRAHEVAHQWWGIGVDFLTYHDQWLSEGFSDFSALWFLQTIRGKNDDYFARLDDWKKAITESRWSIFGGGQQAGPISLGYRTSSTHTPGDYDLIIYKKGAWVLHMLRVLMLDLRTMSDERFTATMRDFYQTYRGRRATTLDFQHVVERHLGIPMDWFFKEWVDGTAIPTYHVKWTTAEGANGQYHVHLHVTQENVPEDFKMYVPVTVDLGDDRVGRLRVKVEGPTTDVDLPLALPSKPKDVRFNDLHGVLADVKME